MSINKVELIIKNEDGINVSVDVLDFPYRLNRTVFTTSVDKLKSLGGTFSTKLKLAKSKRNNKLFKTSDFKSIGKFNKNSDYNAVLLQNGVEVVRGIFKLERILSNSYEGTFLDEDIDWIDRLSKVTLSTLGYVDGSPTWTAPFDGTIDFDTRNVQTNRQTDFVFPTIVYNNTPITDYLDLTDDDIWGTASVSGLDLPNAFPLVNGLFGSRYGLTFQDFPPALYYRNVIEKIFDEINMTVECSLFDEDWFNRIITPYTGDGYKYNWKNLATASSNTPTTTQTGTANMDVIDQLDPLDLQNVAAVVAGSPWINNEKAKFKEIRVIEHDDDGSPLFKDKITAFNKFNIPGQYICPVDGQYTIKVGTGYQNINTDFLEFVDASTDVAWRGVNLFTAYASQEPNSSPGQPTADKWYGWDDNVLVIMRKTEGNGFAYQDTKENLKKWLSGENKDFISEPSDVIAYISPKRYEKYIAGTILDKKEAIGSPITDWQTDVEVTGGSFAPSHTVLNDSLPTFSSESYADMAITLDMQKNERIEMYWISLADIEGNAILIAGSPYHSAIDEASSQHSIGTGIVEPGSSEHFFIVDYNCGLEDLNISENLPSISGKSYISSFIKQFNLYFTKEGNTVRFLPQRNYYTDEVYDVTDRVIDNNWISDPLITQKFLNIGYDNDPADRLLNEVISTCSFDGTSSTNYANVSFENDNVYGIRETNDFILFSSTRFTDGELVMTPFATQHLTIPISTDPVTGVSLIKGPEWQTLLGGVTKVQPLQLPSIQTLDSFNQSTLGDLTYDYNYSPRLIYHLGTVTTIDPTASLYGVLVDSPRLSDVISGFYNANDFIRKPKHWFLPTVSQFDGENSIATGINYPTLRYDTLNGIYNRFFEDIINLYNQSEVLTLKMAMTTKDWVNMRGNKKIRYKDQLYRLMEIKDYDPLTNNINTIKLLKEI